MPTPAFEQSMMAICSLSTLRRPLTNENIKKYQDRGDNLPSFGGNIVGEKSHDYPFVRSSGSADESMMELRHEPGRSHAGDARSRGLRAACAPAPPAGTASPNGTDDGQLILGRPLGKRPRGSLRRAPGAARQLGEAAVGYRALPYPCEPERPSLRCYRVR